MRGVDHHTPVEKPSAAEITLVLVGRVKKARALPIPVARRAKKVSPNDSSRMSGNQTNKDSVPKTNSTLRLDDLFLATEILHELNSFIDGRISAFVLTHFATEVLKRFVPVPGHPGFKIF